MAWSEYVPFAPGTQLVTEARLGPLASVRGSAKVVRVERVLELCFHVPPQSVLLRRVPEYRGRLLLEYQGEGPGSRGIIEAEGHPSAELSIVVRSEPSRRRLEFPPPRDGGPAVSMVVRPRSALEVEIAELSGVPRMLRGLTVSLRAHP